MRSLEQLEREICELAAHLAAATCRWLQLIAEFDEREGWGQWGTLSCAHWLSWRCGIGSNSASEHVRVARALRGLPLMTEAFASGALSYSKVRALTRVASEKTEAQLVELARHATGAQLEKLVRQYRGVLRATTEQARAADERQQLSTYWDEDGMLVVQGRLTSEDGAALLAALEQAKGSLPPSVTDLGPGAARAQALMVLATGGGAGAEVVVHVDAETLASDEVRTQSELADGTPLAPEVVRRLACDGALVSILESGGRPLSVGRRTRAIPPALRRALRSRDRGCRFPGCTHSRHLHAHHIRHWAHGGPTEVENLVQLCSYHHRLVHEGGYRVEVEEGRRLRFRRPDGREVAGAGGVGPAWGPGLVAQHRRRGSENGPDTCRPQSAGDRLDYGIAIDGLIHTELRRLE
jgi:hypothetical protein